MLSTQICVMALTLLGAAPGGFSTDSDCNCVVSSSSAAMMKYQAPVRLIEKEKESR